MAKLAVALVAAAILLICISRVGAHKTHNVTFYVHDSILVPNAKASYAHQFNSTDDRTLAVVAGTGFFEGQKGYAVVHTVAQQLFGTNGAQINTQKWTLVVGK
ncbi:unnamed protein product [Sphagnum balticum]